MFVNCDGTSVDWTVTDADMERAEMDWVNDCQNQLTKDAKF